jgi:hypothetical protein
MSTLEEDEEGREVSPLDSAEVLIDEAGSTALLHLVNRDGSSFECLLNEQGLNDLFGVIVDAVRGLAERGSPDASAGREVESVLLDATDLSVGEGRTEEESVLAAHMGPLTICLAVDKAKFLGLCRELAKRPVPSKTIN